MIVRQHFTSHLTPSGFTSIFCNESFLVSCRLPWTNMLNSMQNNSSIIWIKQVSSSSTIGNPEEPFFSCYRRRLQPDPSSPCSPAIISRRSVSVHIINDTGLTGICSSPRLKSPILPLSILYIQISILICWSSRSFWF